MNKWKEEFKTLDWVNMTMEEIYLEACTQRQVEIDELKDMLKHEVGMIDSAAKEHIEGLQDEIDKLKEQLNNSTMFHCKHFLTTDNGYIACHKNFRDYMLENKYEELGKAHVELVGISDELRAQNKKMRECLEYYADSGTFCPDVCSDSNTIDCRCGERHIVGGRKARALLKELEDA